MSDLSARLDLPLIKPSQAQKHVTHNEAIQILDGLVQAVVEETGAETPPFEPVAGQLFALGPAPTGDWTGEGGKLALRVAEAWLFLTPREGWRAWDKAAGRYKVHDGAEWVDVVMDLDNLERVGIGTSADATNRLALASPASLFSHDGAGHRVKVNKAADTDTASLLFQSGWTGHAEMGLAGDTDFSIKVSDDGATWKSALVIKGATGRATGEAVQQGQFDTSAGRLMRADYGYSPGNLVGTVSMDTGGNVDGAAQEEGSGPNGRYWRYANGMQLCVQTLTLVYNGNSNCTAQWDFPATFSEGPSVGAVLVDTSNATPTPPQLGAPRAFGVTVNNAAIFQYRVAGQTNFASGDSLVVLVSAYGPWN